MGIKEIIAKSRIDFLNSLYFEEKTPGRFFQKEKVDLGEGFKKFIVILGPNMESPIHDHIGQRMTETHLLLYGEGKFIIYNKDGSINREVHLKKDQFHEIFSTSENSPKHKYVAGHEGSITLALEKHY